jgi:hypothetical protein
MVLAVSGLVGAVVTGRVWAQPRPPQQLRFVGRVYDEARRPIDQVQVIVNRRDVRATSDPFGVFHIDLAPGDSTVGFRRIGYRPLLLSLNPPPPPGDTILVELVPSPVELEEVIVTGAPSKPLRYAGTTTYDDVFQRRKVGLGVLIPREAIDKRAGAQTYQLLEGLAGVRIYDAPLKRIRFVRCEEPGGITVWIDGVRQNAGSELLYSGGLEETPEVEMLSRINPSDIEMIEVFRGPSEIPGVFHWNGCAVIAVWSRWNK